MEISVGEQPVGRGATNGTTDIAFGPNGRLLISDGYGNARVLEYTAEGKRVRQWGSAGNGPDSSGSRTGSPWTIRGIIYVAAGRTADCSASISREVSCEWDDLRHGDHP